MCEIDGQFEWEYSSFVFFYQPYDVAPLKLSPFLVLVHAKVYLFQIAIG